MPSPGWTESDVAVNTVICTSVFSALAVGFMTIHVVDRIIVARSEDYMILTAFIVTIMLVGQVIWAVVDQGQGQHAAGMALGKFEVTGKVRPVTSEQVFVGGLCWGSRGRY